MDVVSCQLVHSVMMLVYVTVLMEDLGVNVKVVRQAISVRVYHMYYVDTRCETLSLYVTRVGS